MKQFTPHEAETLRRIAYQNTYGITPLTSSELLEVRRLLDSHLESEIAKAKARDLGVQMASQPKTWKLLTEAADMINDIAVRQSGMIGYDLVSQLRAKASTFKALDL